MMIRAFSSAALAAVVLSAHVRASPLPSPRDNQAMSNDTALVLQQRDVTCGFPHDIPHIAPVYNTFPYGNSNGWALPGDQHCSPGTYCPYACEPGFQMGQWKPGVEFDPAMVAGGAYCNGAGVLEAHIGGDWCVWYGDHAVARTWTDQPVAICQTVKPGHEDMLIRNVVSRGRDIPIAATDGRYCKDKGNVIGAHYYINHPGISPDQGCRWGYAENQMGNWAPFEFSVNVGTGPGQEGKTFAQLGFNPKHLDDHYGQVPNFGVKIFCEGAECGWCEWKPEYGYNSMRSSNAVAVTNHDGKLQSWCVITAEVGSKIVLSIW